MTSFYARVIVPHRFPVLVFIIWLQFPIFSRILEQNFYFQNEKKIVFGIRDYFQKSKKSQTRDASRDRKLWARVLSLIQFPKLNFQLVTPITCLIYFEFQNFFYLKPFFSQMLLGYNIRPEGNQLVAEAAFTDHSHSGCIKTLANTHNILASGSTDERIW